MLPVSVCNVSSCTVHYNAMTIDNENKQVNIDDIGIVYSSNIACQFQRHIYVVCTYVHVFKCMFELLRQNFYLVSSLGYVLMSHYKIWRHQYLSYCALYFNLVNSFFFKYNPSKCIRTY